MTIFSNKTNEYFCDRLHCWKTPPLLIVSRNKGNIYIRDKFFKHISTNKNRASTRPTLPSNFLLRAGCLLRQIPPPYFCKIRREFAFKLKSGRREVRARVTLLFVASRTVVHRRPLLVKYLPPRLSRFDTMLHQPRDTFPFAKDFEKSSPFVSFVKRNIPISLEESFWSTK